jgi:hypothetical protein
VFLLPTEIDCNKVNASNGTQEKDSLTSTVHPRAGTQPLIKTAYQFRHLTADKSDTNQPQWGCEDEERPSSVGARHQEELQDITNKDHSYYDISDTQRTFQRPHRAVDSTKLKALLMNGMEYKFDMAGKFWTLNMGLPQLSVYLWVKKTAVQFYRRQRRRTNLKAPSLRMAH